MLICPNVQCNDSGWRIIFTFLARLDNVLHGAEIVASKGSGDIIAAVEDLDNIDEFHSVGIGRFKLTEVGQYLHII